MTPEWEALIVGINRYPEYTNFNDLTVAALDGANVAQRLEQYGYEPFRIQDLPLGLTQKGAGGVSSTGLVKLEELREAVANLFNPPPPNQPPETGLFFFSGHGCRQEVDGVEEVFLVTSDAFPDVGIYGYPLRELGDQIATSPVKQVVIWLDCCYSGELLSLLPFIPTDKAYCLITATRSFEPGVEISHEQGVFTRELLAGLNPENHPDGIVTSHNLALFIEQRMSRTGQRPLIANSTQAILLTTQFPKLSFQDKCPYRSLSYFTALPEDALVFHGRSQLTEQLIERVKTLDRLLVVLGASGSGKSSLLRAGLLYQLKLGQAIVGSDRWHYLEPFTPGVAPKPRLQEVLEKGKLLDNKGDNSSLTLVATSEPVVMIIDQFEECFTMSKPEQRLEFFNSLSELLEQKDNLIVLIAMRSDFRGRSREYPKFIEKINRPYINVDHLNREEIEEAIAKPAELVGLGIEGRLKQQLINDVEDYPGSLPLLQYTLTELWKQSRQQQETFLRLETYQQLGGIEGTLEKRANQVFDSLSAEEQSVARRLFLELTQVGDTLDTRRRVRLGELVNSHHSLKLLDAVSETLASSENRLITRSHQENSQDVVLDVVHEALIRHWGRLIEWKQTYKEAMVIERKLEAAAEEWMEKGKRRDDAGVLLQGGRLVEAQEHLRKYGELGMLNGLAEEYIEASIKNQQMTRNRYLIQVAFTGGWVLAAVVSTVFVFEFRKQVRKAAESEIKIQSIVSQNLGLLDQPFDALKEGLKAGGKLKEANWVKGDTRVRAIASLRQSLYGVKEFNSLDGHSDVTSVAFSYDGQIIAFASNDNTVKLWNRQGKHLHTLTGHSRSVNSVAFSRDGHTIATASRDNTVKLWNHQGQHLHTLTGHSKSVNSLAFSRDGMTIASASVDNTVKLWNHQGQHLHTLTGHRAVVTSVTFSPDGQTIASASRDNTVKLWNRQGKELHTLTGHSGWVNRVAFSPDGQTIASASDDNTVKLWNRQGKHLQTFSGHNLAHKSVAFSYDGQTIASASDEGTVKLRNLEGKELHTLTGHSGLVKSVAFSRDGKAIASASYEGTVKLWNLEQKEPLTLTLTGHSKSVNSVAFSQDGQRIASASDDNTVKLWNHQGKYLRTLTGHSNDVNSVAFSRDGQTIASASDDNTVKLWNLKGKELHTLTGHSYPVNSVAFSRDGMTIASASFDNTVKLWNHEGKELHTLTGHSKSVNSVAFSRDGMTIASASDEGTVKLWNHQGKYLRTLTGHRAPVKSVAFSRDGMTIASASDEGTVKLWNREGKELHTLTGHSGPVNSVAFSRDGMTIASAGRDNTVKLWNLEGKHLHTLTGHSYPVKSLVFSRDGQTIASATDEGTVIFWNFDLNDLVAKSCDWLHDYLVTHQEEKELRKICGIARSARQ
ncbi:caspase family protein [Moorena producens JHB]|uniref:Caspase family protein n=1 Tax=Moorena producens (strain JHB) TaxID=1454205 RepID=A0A9Q9SUK6_MOOP1|nr:caspase family protein [Moorena producens]WAN69922.1 caspase family protein [Moorena producens JHB]